jgi:peptide/nickel transport system substrate-binding protein
MPFARRWLARGLDAVAVLVVLYAIFHFVLQPRLFGEAALPAPPVDLASLGGGRFSLAAHRGRVVFLDFWASWCEPCKESLPLVERYARTHPGVDVIPVDVGEDRATAAGFARDHGLASVALDPDEIAARAFGVSGFPTMVVVDPSGTMRAKWIGFNPAIEAEMATALERFGRAATHTTSRLDGWIAPANAAILRPPVLTIEDDPNSLDTIRNTPFGWELGPLTQGYLFLVDDRGALVPDRALAVPTRRNGGISPDGRTITYRIRTGKWSDGAPFDARDVAFTIDALRNPRTAVPDTSAVAAVASYTVRDPGTLVIRLKAASAPFVSSFLSEGANDPFSILPRHIAARYASLDRSSLDADPVGLGPFRLTRWERGERLEFERNPFYWRGAARSASITVAVVPDAATRLVLARTGEVDVIEVAGLDLDAARAVPALELRAGTTNVVDYLQFNLHSPAVRDRDVRLAFARAIDRPRLAANVYRTTLVPTDSVQSDPRYRATAQLPAFDPAAARRLLRGRHVALDLAIATHWRNSANAAVSIVSDLAAVGITATIHGYTEDVFWGPKDAGGILESARYDVALTSWAPALDPARSYLFGCVAAPPGGGNSMFFCDPHYDRDEADGARVYAPASRAPFYRDAGNRLIAQLPVLPLGFERRTYAVNRHLHGFRPNVLGRGYWNAWELTTAP